MSHCASYKVYWRVGHNLHKRNKKAVVPHLIWSNGHSEWSRWYFFKGGSTRISNQYDF